MPRVLIRQYDDDESHAMSRSEVAAALGISRVRVQQLEQSALKKLRNSGLLDGWRDYLRKRLHE